MSSIQSNDIPDQFDPSKVTISDLLKQVSNYNAGVEASKPIVQAAVEQQQGLEASTADILNQVGTDSSTISLAASAADMDRQARVAKAAALMGVDVNAQNERYSKLVQVKQEAEDTQQEALKAIKQKQSVGLFDNPMQYLINGFTVHKDVAQYNTAETTALAADTAIQRMNAEAQQTFQTQKELAVGTTAASAAAAARNAAASAIVQANQAKIQGLQYGITGVEKANNFSKEQYDAMYTGLGAIKMEEGLKMQQAQLKLAKDQFAEHIREFNINDQYRQDQQDDRDALQNLGQSYVDAINKGRVARGATPLDDVSGKQVIAIMRTGKGALTSEMQFDYANGSTMLVKGGEQQVLATSPTDIVQAIAKGIPINFTPQQQPVINLVKQVVGEANNPNRNDPGSLKFSQDYNAAKLAKNPDAMRAVFDARVNDMFSAKAANVNPQDPTNPFAITSINALSQQSPTVSNTAFFQKVLKDRAAAGEQLNDPNKIINAGVAALAKGTITMPEMLEASTIYQVGVNNARAQRNIQGITGIVPSLGFNTPINGQIVDLTKPDALARSVMQALRAQEAKKNFAQKYGRVTDSPEDLKNP